MKAGHSDKKEPGASSEFTAAEVARILLPYQVEVDERLAGEIVKYLNLLLRWNEKMSLTTVEEPMEVLERHFGESLFGAKVAEILRGKLLDVGSGAGFPGLPLAMLQPEIQALLLEPNLKKSVFLAEVRRELRLEERVQIKRKRLEDLEDKGRVFDFVTMRAVRVTNSILVNTRRLLREEGKLVLWVGAEGAKEVRQAAGWEWSEEVCVPGSKERVILWGRLRE